MEASAKSPDPWQHILKNLREPRSPHVPKVKRNSCENILSTRNTGRTDRVSSLRCVEYAQQPSSCVRINILERLERVAVISWSDPTTSNYTDQPWRRMFARRNGTCALTGARISFGDDVFMPATRSKTKPINYGAVILTSAMPGVSGI